MCRERRVLLFGGAHASKGSGESRLKSCSRQRKRDELDERVKAAALQTG